MLCITLERLKELLCYDPLTGKFTWLYNHYRTDLIGREAGTLNHTGYISICCDGRKYQAHQLAWFYMTGEWIKEPDHKDTVRSNNVWSNLRPATRSLNRANSQRGKNNTTGFKGVKRCKGRFQARIGLDGKSLFLGSFATPEEAAAAYAIAAKRYFGEFART
jgi:HNH endonuclease